MKYNFTESMYVPKRHYYNNYTDSARVNCVNLHNINYNN